MKEYVSMIDLIPLKTIISFDIKNSENKKLGIYEYKISLSFENYIKIINNLLV